MPTRKELIASSQSVESIRKHLGIESLGYLSTEGMLSMPSLPNSSFCVSCFTGKYPLKIEKNHTKSRLEKV
jgi:amidophosphoribosyltransferase